MEFGGQASDMFFEEDGETNQEEGSQEIRRIFAFAFRDEIHEKIVDRIIKTEVAYLVESFRIVDEIILKTAVFPMRGVFPVEIRLPDLICR